MHFFVTVLLGIAAFLWILCGLIFLRGVPSIPSLADVAPLEDARCPAISILFAARDEAEKLPAALETMLALDYPRYEVVAADDRSIDSTKEILKRAAERDARLKCLRIDSLPAGWLGKPHALEKAFENSSGEWLVFTDADVHFEPDLLRRAIALAQSRGWDHMPLLGHPMMHGLGEKIAMTFFGIGFLVGIRPWSASNPKSRAYAGVGAFQLIRRSVYQAIGTHRRLAMEVIDDVKLGKLVKEGGFRSGVARAGTAVMVHWHAGIRNMVRGTEKNFFAASGFRLPVTLIQIFGLLFLSVFPWLALGFVHGWALWFACIAVGVAILAHASVALEFGASPFYALSHPFGALLYAWMLGNSTFVTLRRGGITWRGTFYPIEELKRGVV